MKPITLERIIELAFNTSLAYFVFFLSFASVPYAQALCQETTDVAKSLQGSNYVVIGETKLAVEIADSDAERVRGLSGRASLEQGTGLLFIFDTSDIHGIWMKDMKFAIDIVWVADNMQVVHIEKNVTPDTYPTVFKPNRPARFVLEMPAGLVSKEGIKYGDLLTVF